MRTVLWKISPKDTATEQQRAAGSCGPCSRSGLVLLQPFHMVTARDLASQMQTRSLSPGTAYRCTSWDEGQLYFFFQFSLICPCGLEQNLTLNPSVFLPRTLPSFEVPVSDPSEIYLVCMHKDCKQSSGYAGIHIYTYSYRNHFFTCFPDLLKKCIAQQQLLPYKTVCALIAVVVSAFVSDT